MKISEEIKLMPLVPFALALIIGLFFGYFVSIPLWLLLSLMGASIVFGILLSKKKQLRFFPLLLCTFCLGAFLMTRENARLTPLLPSDKSTLTVVVEDSPKQTDWGYLLSCYVINTEYSNSITLLRSHTFTPKIRCSWNDPTFIPEVGQTLIIEGKLRNTDYKGKSTIASNGNFNYDRWLKSHSYLAKMVVYGDKISMSKTSELEKLDFIDRVGVKAKIIRARILSSLKHEGIEDENYAIVAAMGFGDKSTLSQSTRDVFSQTGAAHLLALSGMHLGILFVLLSMFVSHLNVILGSRFDYRFWGQILVIATIWGYVVLVGMPQSVVRSAVMLTIYAAISSSSRQKMSLNALAVTAILMLIVNPMSIWDVGFQMSFMAMVGIFVYHTPIYNIIRDEWLFEHPILRKLWALVCISFAAQIGTMPLSVYYFGRIPTLFLLTNIIAIPIVTLLLYCLFLSLVLWAVPFLRALFILCVQGLSNCLTYSLGIMAKWDILSINNISINWIQMMLIYMIIILVTIILVKTRKIYLLHRAHSILK